LEAGWAPEPVWTLGSKEKYIAFAGNRIPPVHFVAQAFVVLFIKEKVGIAVTSVSNIL
jgi:hypothetical protein